MQHERKNNMTDSFMRGQCDKKKKENTKLIEKLIKPVSCGVSFL